jgi:hypothetical protein
VGIGSESRIISEIPARVIWIIVYHDVVAVPQPVASVVIVIRRHAPEKATEAEMVTASAFEAINVVAANFATEASVFPDVILMVTRIVAAAVMTNPLIAVSMNVRSFWVALLVAERLTPLVTAGTPLVATRTACATSAASLCLSWAARGSRTPIRNVASADLRAGTTTSALMLSTTALMLSTATAAPVLTAASTCMLRKRRKRRNQEDCKQTC